MSPGGREQVVLAEGFPFGKCVNIPFCGCCVWPVFKVLLDDKCTPLP